MKKKENMSSRAPAGSGPNDKSEGESPYMPSQDKITALGSGSWAELMMKQERPRMPVDRMINQTMQQAKAKNMNKLARSYRYRVEGVYSSEDEANLWLAAAARQRGGAPGYSGEMSGEVFRVFRL